MICDKDITDKKLFSVTLWLEIITELLLNICYFLLFTYFSYQTHVNYDQKNYSYFNVLRNSNVIYNCFSAEGILGISRR